MDAPVIFDTLAFVKRMEAAGMASPQAEALAEAINEVALDKVATKTDLHELRHDLTIRIGTIVAAASAIVVALLGGIISLR